MIPAGAVITRCRSCNARIVWALTTANGKNMPVDVEPVLGGNVVLVSGPEARVLNHEETQRREAQGEKLHVSHFTTCPNATSWRRS